MKNVGIVVIGIITIIVLVAGSWAYRYYTAPIRGAVDAQEQLESGQSRIEKYNHFYDLYATIQSDRVALETQKKKLETLRQNNVDQKEISRTISNIAGIQAQLRRNINQYNVDARKEFTRARFKPDDLPTTIEQ